MFELAGSKTRLSNIIYNIYLSILRIYMVDPLFPFFIIFLKAFQIVLNAIKMENLLFIHYQSMFGMLLHPLDLLIRFHLQF